MHDVVIVGIPLIVIIAGILFNRSDVRDLRTEAAARHTEIMARLASIETDLRHFYHLTGNLDGRVTSLEKH